MVAPAAPEPAQVPHSAPRTLWRDEAGKLQLVAHDWADGYAPTYSVRARHGRQWQPATGEEVWECFMALCAWIDEARGSEEEREA